MEHFYERIDGWFTFPKLYSLMVKKFQDGATFVEVGSWRGRSASYMAVEIINSKKQIDFYCVDTWKGSDEHRRFIDLNELYEMFKSNIEPVKDYIKPLRMTSLEAAQTFKNQSVDFVFIDAAHDYDNVKADIEAWYPKVKKGGVIGGHDYHNAWPGVVQAVDEFCKNNNFIPQLEEVSWVVFND